MSKNSIGIALVQETYLKPNRPKACSIAGYVQLGTDRTHSREAVILFGDFNCKNIRWGCPSNNYNGIKLDELEDRLDFGIIAPSMSTCFPHVVKHTPSTIDIAFTKGVALNFNSIETIHGLTSDHRPVTLKMGPPDGGRPISIHEIDFAIGALTNHVRTVVEENEREVPASSDRRKFPPNIFELIRAKNAALRRASAYPTPEYRSRARALQREVKARVREFRNESWSNLMEKIKPSHKAFWAVTKALKTEGYTPLPPLKKPDNLVAIDDAEIAECLADSIETQRSHASPPHDIAHISRIEEEVLQKTSLEPKRRSGSRLTQRSPNASIHKPGKPRNLPASYRPISLLGGLGKLFEKILKTRLGDHLLGKGLIIDEQFGFGDAYAETTPLRMGFSPTLPTRTGARVYGIDIFYTLHVASGEQKKKKKQLGFRPAHSCPQQVLRLVEEGFETERSTVAVFFDVAKNRSTRFTLLPLQRAIDELGQWFRKWRIEVNPDKSAAIQFKYGKIRSRLIVDKNTPNLKMLDANIPWQRNYKYLGVTLDKNLHFRDHIERVRNNAHFYKARLGAMVGRKSKLSRRNKRTIYKMCIRTVMTYASPVFAHAAPKALHRLQVIQNKFCRAATDAHWCVRNSILHRDLELPSISKYMKDASKRFFDIVGSHLNALLRAAIDYQPSPPTYLIRRPRNVLTDPPDALTAAVESLNDVNDTHD
ncbi:Probable RNA-directed DNA polymerase from transposon X-element [Eumeta japonica]|uniref:Probable RNA-directed DNA polymerase from transposon X-element n=1 Tax=Eumeta variegata TaxID=151549 RepID=A0A4C1Z5K9_EUMVA|nr:Probable RNA-directed DNA polymerase from transposon X-element [Eumeta japonica]